MMIVIIIISTIIIIIIMIIINKQFNCDRTTTVSQMSPLGLVSARR